MNQQWFDFLVDQGASNAACFLHTSEMQRRDAGKEGHRQPPQAQMMASHQIPKPLVTTSMAPISGTRIRVE